METKTCGTCGNPKSIEEFGLIKSSGKRRKRCKQCDSDSQIRRYHSSEEEKLKFISRSKEAKRKRFEKGLCWQCGEAVEEDSQRCSKHNQENRDRAKKSRTQARVKCFEAYGGAFCACCGESNPKFLTLDHVNNDGGHHRKLLFGETRPTSHQTIRSLEKKGYPPGFQVLCWNCNCGRAMNGGICPHKEELK